MKDPYLIEYLVKSGYDRGNVISDQFNIDDLEDSFTTPIDLSKISNLEEIKIFFMVSAKFLIGEEDIRQGRTYVVSKLLPNFKLIGKEPGLKLNKLFVGKNSISVVKNGEASRRIVSQISLENLNLAELVFDIQDRKAGNILGTDGKSEQQIEAADKVYILKINPTFDRNRDGLLINESSNEFPDFFATNCSNLEFSKFNTIGQSVSLDVVGCKNISCREKTNFRRLNIKDYKDCRTDFLKNIFAIELLLNNLSSLDLADIGEFDYIKIDTVGKCYASRNCEIKQAMNFNNVSFSNTYDAITTIKTATMEECTKQDASTMFDIQNAEFKNCNFNLVLGSRVNKNLRIKNCYDVDKRIEEVIDRADETEDFSLSISDIDGYDIT